MAVQKLLAEADKLFEKGKHAEGINKIKQALAEEPLNQIVATKLANIYVQNREPHEASKVYGFLAKKLSDAGKGQVAIAIYKQAVELAPDDISLRVRYAQECESGGKLGDAFLQGQVALQHFLRRKKYFDAADLMPLLARSQPKDEKIKLAWVETLWLSQAEQKLIHFLVAACGPPGLVSQDFPVGGEPSSMSPALFEGLKKLVPYFPRDPRVAYAAAWACSRRGQKKQTYHYLRECLRRDPDFSLALLFFARLLAEDQKLNEALFVYKYFKVRMSSDRSVDMLTLNRLLEAFVEKNGWIKFIEDSGEVLDTAGFLQAITGDVEAAKEAAKANEEEDGPAEKSRKIEAELPPAEIELGGGADLPAEGGMEIVLATGQTLDEASQRQKAAKEEKDPLKLQAELIKAAIEATVAGMGGQPQPAQQTVVQPVMVPVVQAATQLSPEVLEQAQNAVAATLASGVPPAEPAADAQVESKPEAEAIAPPVEPEPGPTSVETAPAAPAEPSPAPAEERAAEPPAAQETPAPDSQASIPPPVVFTPEPSAKLAEPGPEPEKEPTQGIDFQGDSVEFTSLIKPNFDPEAAGQEEPTLSLSPASDGEEVTQGGGGAAPEPPKITFNPMEHAADTAASPDAPPEREDRTEMFSPMDVLDAGNVMKNRALSDVPTRPMEIDPSALESSVASSENKLPAAEMTATEADRTKWKELQVTGEPTIVFSPVEAVQATSDSRRPFDPVPIPAKGEWTKEKPAAAPEATPTPGLEGESGGDATMVLPRPGVLGENSLNDLANEGEATRILTSPPPFGEPVLAPAEQGDAASSKLEPTAEVPPPSATPAPVFTPLPEVASPAPAVMPLPEPVPIAGASVDSGDGRPDLGEDLLEGATRIFTQPTSADKTEHLLKEIKKEMKQKANAFLNIDMLVKKAERYTAKRNYYLARKALRHAQALGADEETIKAKLREIRKLEYPEGLYNTISSDRPEKVDTSEVLERLEQEFDLSRNLEDDSEGSLASLVENRIEEIFTEADPRTILDFGVGLHEMGLYRQAEALLMRLVEEFPDYAFDAYYLAAMAKLSRRDYAGAASILKRLSSDAGKTDLEKIQIYYALGETFEKMRQRERSRKFFQKVAELDANYRNIRHKLEE